MKVLTEQHLRTARQMPRKTPYLYVGMDQQRRSERQAKRERRTIAAYYRLIRSLPREDGYGRHAARISHRYGVVTTAGEAKTRMANIQAGYSR